MGPKNIGISQILNQLTKIDDLAMKASAYKLEEMKLFTEKDRRNVLLELQLVVLQNTVNLLAVKCDKNEQYSRRVSTDK